MSRAELDNLLEKLREQAESGQDSDFSRKEVAAIKRVIRTYEMLESWGRLGRFLIWAAMTVAGLTMAWSQMKSDLIQ